MNFDHLHCEIARLQEKYALVDFGFDTECLYALGDLSRVLQEVLDRTLPTFGIHVAERLSDDGREYVATLSTAQATAVFTAGTAGDWLPDHFFEDLENLPAAFGSPLRFYPINPAIGLTGQDVWYFCGTEAHLRAARQEGLPLLFPGEHCLDAPEYHRYKDFI